MGIFGFQCRRYTTQVSDQVKLKRFYKSCNVYQSDIGYQIRLDSKPLKTPLGVVIELPVHKHALALLTALEWESQESVIKSFSLPITSLVMRSIDGFGSRETRAEVIDQLLEYVHNDTIWCLTLISYQQSYPDSLCALQEQYWDPIIDWINRTYSLQVIKTDGILSVKQIPETLIAFRGIIEGYDNYKLAAFEKAVLRSKSFMIGLALIEREISVEFASCAALVETTFQQKRWGEVEDSHDVDKEDMRRQLGSAIASLVTFE